MLNLPETISNKIISVLSAEPSVKQAIVFGSRARGDARDNSDIDLALMGCQIPLSLNTKLRESIGLYSIDIVRIDELDNEDLMASIKRDGIVIYSAQDAATLA